MRPGIVTIGAGVILALLFLGALQAIRPHQLIFADEPNPGRYEGPYTPVRVLPRGSALPVTEPTPDPSAGAAVRGLTGIASWYRYTAGEAAAGPALRLLLGSHWRGMTVTVTGPAGTMRLRLTDWMRADRLIDLAAADFPSVCAALSKGLCRVTIVDN